MRGKNDRSTAQGALATFDARRFPAASMTMPRRRRASVGRVVEPLSQSARSFAKGAQWIQEPDSLVAAKESIADIRAISASLTTNTAADCPVGGTQPTIPKDGNELLVNAQGTPGPPASSHGVRRCWARLRRRSVKRWAKSQRCVAGCSCPFDCGNRVLRIGGRWRRGSTSWHCRQRRCGGCAGYALALALRPPSEASQRASGTRAC